MRRLMAAAFAALTIGGLTLAALGGGSPAHADVNDFSFASFNGDYRLGTDADGRSTLTVVETLVAEFPQSDQNRGIRRELVDTYDGHPTDLRVSSVTDENGTPRHYESDSDDDVESLTIAGDAYVHGRQTYVITYTQHNVTRYFGDTDDDEFYWDVNGTGWAQSFARVSATVHLASGLRDALTGKVDAVSGSAGSSTPASVMQTDDGFAFEATDLGAGENLTFAIGFSPHTFTPRADGFWATPWPPLSALMVLLGVLTAAAAFVLRFTRLKDAPGRGTIVPEYLPPTDAGIALSALVSGTTARSVPAQVLALAVSGRINVREAPSTGLFGKPTYDLEFVGTNATGRQAFRAPEPTADELEFLHALFGDTLTPGETRSLAKQDSAAVKRLSAFSTRVRKDAVVNGYRRSLPVGLLVGVVLAAVATSALALLFAFVALDRAVGGFWPGVFVAVGLVAGVLSIIAIARWPLAARGVELRDHLRGLDLYIGLAEADRIRYLQSPQGALRTPVAADDPAQVLELNERLLPWAVLFKQEKKWLAELGRAYEQQGGAPTWYYGTSVFNAAAFASGVSGVTASTTSTFSASSGGSGGASSGGGGGGGGGGGV
ncbi:DUF2207 domain-containing protein [Glaciibacter flavus]|uniref:DUF2207 domain-containing protein n=1 Tax=Orlajensenia flava TaxID=2565934 RepID=UPI003B00CE66